MQQFSSRPDLSMHDVSRQLHSDAPLSPRIVSSLLNIEVTLPSLHRHTEAHLDKPIRRVVRYLFTVLVSVFFALLMGTLLLYAYELGPFEQQTFANS
jgi:hypothetical protein